VEEGAISQVGVGRVICMPHITVEYSGALDGAFDRRAFAQALHPLTAKIINTKVDGCRTRFRRIDEADLWLGDGEPGHAMIHVVLAILSGRAPETKAELTEAVTALLKEHVDPGRVPGTAVNISVDVTDLDRAWYRSGVM
jgi:5-carboxymethyl-2-hydroxymuconate isomerase